MITTKFLVGITDVLTGENFVSMTDGQEDLGRLVLTLGERYVVNSVSIIPNFVEYGKLMTEIQSSDDENINLG